MQALQFSSALPAKGASTSRLHQDTTSLYRVTREIYTENAPDHLSALALVLT